MCCVSLYSYNDNNGDDDNKTILVLFLKQSKSESIRKQSKKEWPFVESLHNKTNDEKWIVTANNESSSLRNSKTAKH